MSIDSAPSLLSSEIILGKISEIALQIQQGRELESILQWAIEDAKALLQADRVLVYCFLEEQDAVAAFESVGGEWASALGQQTDECCTDINRLKRYKQGQPITISDIRESTLAPCCVHLSEALQVQASLTIPILVQGNLWGLLVAHHCHSSHEWQSLEIQLLQHMSLQFGVAIQQAKLRQHQQHLESQLEQLTVDHPQATIALQANQDAAWTWNGLTNEAWFSSRWKKMRGLEDHEVSNDLQEWSKRIHPEDVEQVMQAVQTHFVNPASRFEQEYRVRHQDGSYRWVHDRGQAICDDSGRVISIARTETDITEKKQSEVALQESEQRFRLLSQLAPVGIFLTDAVRHCTYANDCWVGLTQLPIEQAIGEGWQQAIHPDDRTDVLAEWDAMIQEDREFNLEYRFLRPDGSTVWVTGKVTAIKEPNGNISGFIGTVSDISNRKQQEALLRRYERIVSGTPDCVSLIDCNYIYQAVNKTYLTWNQKSYDQIVGHSVSDLLGQEFFEAVPRPFLDRCLAGESKQTLETWQDYADGQRRYVRATYTTCVEADGTISGVLINVHDLTDLKLAEAALRESEERFRQMATNIHEVFWLAEIDFAKMIYISPVYEEIWGRSCASVYEQPKSLLAAIHPEDRAQVLATIQQQRLTGFNHEYRLIRPDGTIRWIWERAFPVADSTGHPYRLAGVCQDITDRKAAEIALAESRQRYQTLVENSPDIIERFDRELRHLYVSPVLTKITGIPVEFFLGKTCRDLQMDEAMISAWESAASVLLATGQKQMIEFEITTLQGVRSFEMAIAPELADPQSEQPMIESILCLSRDVTDRKATETALRQQKQFTEQIASSTLAILYVYDLIEQRNVYSNQQIEAVLGYSIDEIQEMGDGLFPLLIHPEDLPYVMANQQRLLKVQDDEFVETEYRMRHKSGSYRWLLSRDRIFSRNADGTPTQSLGIATDISILKEAQTSLHQQVERQRLLTAIAQHIRQTLNLDRILDTTVDEVRQFLHTDRVIIYRFEPDWSGIIIAESTAENWRSILGMQITDTYFVENQGQPYLQGEVKPTDDIYAANLDPCHIALLEQMQVRAKLVVPILQEDHLWGLLVAQHCEGPRQWTSLETELLQQLATQIGIAIQQADLYRQSQRELADRQRAEIALQQLNQELEQRVQERTQSLHQQAEQERLLRLIIQNIHCSLDLEETLNTVLNETRHTLSADRVAIYRFNPDWSGCFVAESVGQGWMSLVQPDRPIVWADTYLQDTAGGRYQHNEAFAVDDIYTIGHSPCHIELLEQFQARAYAIAPIFIDGALWGLLAVYQNCSSRQWQDWELSLLKQIGIQMAIALRQSLLYQAVQTQVQELERLNHLKDDFLSTVSHELRSPMSSIKMATEMLEITLKPLGVLDNESNAISRYVKILREEGKREISLINDLLDLARLDAGTEPLNPIEVDLSSYIPHLAESFVERTQQQHQHLSIQIADNLLPFITDLPFLERILTELLHNACKYTPSGETITVSAQSTASALEIRISNSGVEIPSAECDRVFDKFYRIPNNDPWKHGGTGLGLALVKKLTERLGGSIRVESGNGQTAFILEFSTSPDRQEGLAFLEPGYRSPP